MQVANSGLRLRTQEVAMLQAHVRSGRLTTTHPKAGGSILDTCKMDVRDIPPKLKAN